MEIMAGRKYSTFAICPRRGDLNIAEMPFLKNKSYYKTTNTYDNDEHKESCFRAV